jgi:hypothetical protein
LANSRPAEIADGGGVEGRIAAHDKRLDRFPKTQLRPTLKRIDAYVIRWGAPQVQADAP